MKQRVERRSSHALELDRLAAAAGLGHVRIVEHETGFQQRGLVVDLGAKKEHLRHRRDHHSRAVLFDHLVMGVDLGHVFHRVFHARAATFLDADAQALMVVAVHQLRDLRGGGGGHGDRLLSGDAKHEVRLSVAWFRYMKPSSSRASSLIMSMPQGGSQTRWTSTCLTPARGSIASATQPGISPATGQPGAVRVMVTLIAFSASISIV